MLDIDTIELCPRTPADPPPWRDLLIQGMWFEYKGDFGHIVVANEWQCIMELGNPFIKFNIPNSRDLTRKYCPNYFTIQEGRRAPRLVLYPSQWTHLIPLTRSYLTSLPHAF